MHSMLCCRLKTQNTESYAETFHETAYWEAVNVAPFEAKGDELDSRGTIMKSLMPCNHTSEF